MFTMNIPLSSIGAISLRKVREAEPDDDGEHRHDYKNHPAHFQKGIGGV